MTIDEAHKFFTNIRSGGLPEACTEGGQLCITMQLLVIFGAPWTKQGTWMLSGTGDSGCKN